MDVQGPRSYAIGTSVLDLGRGALVREGQEVPLRPMAFRVLQHLAGRAGRLVARQELLDAVWGRRAVTDDCLTQCIVEIRRALGPDKGVLRTVARRGFILETAPGPDTVRTTEAGTAPDRPRERRSLAARTPALAAGLALLAVVTVSSGPSTPPPVTASTPAPATPARADAAREAYLLGRHFFHRRGSGDLASAERHLERAVALAPGDAAAWTALAGAYHVRGMEEFGDPRYRVAERRAALERALRLDPAHTEARVRLFQALRSLGEHERAAAEFARARTHAPDHPMVVAQVAAAANRAGRLDEASALWRRLIAHDPLSALHRWNLAQTLLGAGRYAEALVELRHVQRLSPGLDVDVAIGRALIAADRIAEACPFVRSLPPGSPRDQLVALFEPGECEEFAARARRADARGTEPAVLQAEIAAQRGDHDAALALLVDAVEDAVASGPDARLVSAADVWNSPFLRTLHGDARWQALVGRLADQG